MTLGKHTEPINYQYHSNVYLREAQTFQDNLYSDHISCWYTAVGWIGILGCSFETKHVTKLR